MRYSDSYAGERSGDELGDKVREGGRRSLLAILRWIGDHVRGFYTALGLFLTLGLALAVGAILLFGGVAALVESGLTERVDNTILRWFDGLGSARLDGYALEMSALGSASVTTAVVIVASLVLWQIHHRYSAVLLWIALVGGWILSRVLKSVFDRPRPDLFEWRTPHAGASSYPSGHSLTAMVVYATLMYLMLRIESTSTIRRATVFVFSLIIVMVGISRVYLGVHFPSDVVGGYLVGFGWATVCALGIEAIRYFRSRHPEVVRDEPDLDAAPDRG